jgi:hypothetical protein
MEFSYRLLVQSPRRDNERWKIFVSHTPQDDEFVRALREKLEAHQIPVWVDSREMRGGSKLVPEIEQPSRMYVSLSL